MNQSTPVIGIINTSANPHFLLMLHFSANSTFLLVFFESVLVDLISALSSRNSLQNWHFIAHSLISFAQ
jgi:hypothetical protein